ncbi:MAG: DUF5309 family protein [Pseudomonadota bacterium]
MAAPTNTATTLTQKGNREDLEDIIARIAPEETPFSTNIGSASSADATYHEWQTEDLATPNADNAQLEGDDTDTFEENVTTRVGNVTQIFKRAFVVSGTQEKVRKAGRKSEIGRHRAIKGREIKRDAEAAFLSANASVRQSGSTARKSGGAQAWITTNESRGTGGSSGGFNSSTNIVDAPTSGTDRQFDEATLKTVMQSIFTNGGTMKRRALYVSPHNKVDFSGFTGIAENRNQMPNSGMARITGAAELYQSDFGELAAIPCAYGITDAALIADHDYFGISTLRAMKTEKLSKTGDNEKHHIICEKTLVCKNEKAHGIVADLLNA